MEGKKYKKLANFKVAATAGITIINYKLIAIEELLFEILNLANKITKENNAELLESKKTLLIKENDDFEDVRLRYIDTLLS